MNILIQHGRVMDPASGLDQPADVAVQDGRIVERNFDTYPIARLYQMPKIESVIAPTYDFWGGVGEPTICVVAPAVMNAIAAATGKPNRWTQHDTGAASVSMAYQAVAMGLVIHQMGGWDAEKARAAFAIPPEYTPMAMIAVGYQAEPSVLHDDVKVKELTPRKRRPLGECFFAGNWGKPYGG